MPPYIQLDQVSAEPSRNIDAVGVPDPYFRLGYESIRITRNVARRLIELRPGIRTKLPPAKTGRSLSGILSTCLQQTEGAMKP
jgi:hypothetical protein